MEDGILPEGMAEYVTEKKVLALTGILKQGETFGTELSREIKTTYAHTVKLITDLEENGLIRTEVHGRKKIIELTDPGQEIAESLVQLINTFKTADIKPETGK